MIRREKEHFINLVKTAEHQKLPQKRGIAPGKRGRLVTLNQQNTECPAEFLHVTSFIFPK
jgi:hypothetical protein